MFEGASKTPDLAREHGISEATIYNWKAKFGGMDVSEARPLRALEEENAKLKNLLAEQMLAHVGGLVAPTWFFSIIGGLLPLALGPFLIVVFASILRSANL